MPIESFYYVDAQSRRCGPVPVQKLRELSLRPDTMVWHDELPDWRPLKDVPELYASPGARSAPPPLPAASRRVPSAGNTGLIAAILGVAGIAWWILPGWVFIAAPLSLAAVVTAVVALYRARGGGPKGLAITGLVLGILNACLAGVMLLIIGLFVTADIRRRESAPRTVSPPAVPATIPTMPRRTFTQPTFPTSYPSR